jgi:hypothetical protein
MLSETHATSPHDHGYTSLRTVDAMNVNAERKRISFGKVFDGILSSNMIGKGPCVA